MPRGKGWASFASFSFASFLLLIQLIPNYFLFTSQEQRSVKRLHDVTGCFASLAEARGCLTLLFFPSYFLFLLHLLPSSNPIFISMHVETDLESNLPVEQQQQQGREGDSDSTLQTDETADQDQANSKASNKFRTELRRRILHTTPSWFSVV